MTLIHTKISLAIALSITSLHVNANPKICEITKEDSSALLRALKVDTSLVHDMWRTLVPTQDYKIDVSTHRYSLIC